ncbi:hypothetical protein AAW14_29760 [Streptomyces hygroscopicus]|nr:hypothetical protein [Streptomyces hygroscopicus]
MKPEHLSKVEGVRALGRGLFELSIDAEPFQSRLLAAQGPTDPAVTGATSARSGLVVDQQVEVGRVWPALAPVFQPGQQ